MKDSNTTRLVLTVVISLAIMLVWFRFFAPKPKKGTTPKHVASKPTKSTGKKSDTSDKKDAKAVAHQPTSQPATSKEGGPRSLSIEGTHTTFDWKGGNAALTFTSHAGALRRALMKNPRFKELKGGKLVPIDLVQTRAKEGPWPFLATFRDSDFEVPQDARYTLIKRDDQMLHYRWSSDKVQIDKVYRLDKKLTSGTLVVKVTNLTKSRLDERLEMKLFARQDSTASKPGFTNPYPRVPTGICHVNGEIHRRSVGAINGSQSGCTPSGCGMGSGVVEQVGEVNWIASDDRYFLIALIPHQLKQGLCRLRLRDQQKDVIEVSLQYPQIKIAPQKSVEHSFAFFLGTKDLDQLDAVETQQKRDLGLSDSIEFGSFAIICRPMLALMKFFYSFLGNWGLAIILLTLIVKLLTFWPTHKSMKSMRQMQKLKPEMDALRERYKDDKQRLNQETMAMYKKHKVNPLGGCLPMLLQMPVWFALYRTLGNAQELYRSGFGLWITDLTAPDPYFVLPIAMGVAMFAQQLMTPSPMEGPQAKIMKYFMPGMFTFMMLWLPAGLTLYIFVNTLLSVAHQVHMNRSDPLPTSKSDGDSTGNGGNGGRGPQPAGDQRSVAGAASQGPRVASRGKKKRRRKTK